MCDSEKLIEAVRSHEVLYDTNHLDYMKSKLKDEIWNKIAQRLKIKDGVEAKRIWLKLRNCHRDALRRQKRCAIRGSAAKHTKGWRYQEQMQFLMPYMGNRPRQSNFPSNSDSETEENSHIENESQEITETVNVNNSDSEDPAEEDDVMNTESITHDESFEETKWSRKNISKKPRKEDTAALIKMPFQRHEQRAQERSKERELTRKQAQEAETPNDHMYHFFMAMYGITKKMPSISQHLVMNRVFEAVSQVEADILNIQYSENIQTQNERPQVCYSSSSSTSTGHLSRPNSSNSFANTSPPSPAESILLM